MHNDEQSVTRRVPDRYETLFAAGSAGIMECCRQGVIEHAHRFLEGHLVLPEVRLGLLPVPNEVHDPFRFVNALGHVVVDAGDPVRAKR